MAENADIVRRAFDAFSRRDLSALLAISDPEIEFMPATARVAGRGEPYRGHEGLRTYLADVARVWQEPWLFGFRNQAPCGEYRAGE